MIKVDIISGFLGAGKTTLIRKLLKAHEDEKVVLIENEFGEIGIDGEVVEREGFQVLELSTGCICCSMKIDFLNTIKSVVEQLKPERIIIEPTGIGLLSEIIEVVNITELKDKCYINSLITVVDSINYLEQLDSFGDFFEDQIANASTLMLSKTQFVEEEEIKNIISSLRTLNKDAFIVKEIWSEFSIEYLRSFLNGELIVDFDKLFHLEDNHSLKKGIENVSLSIEREFSWKELEKILISLNNPLYGNILRGKGFIKGTEKDLEFNYVNGQYNIKECEIEGSGRMCIIGKDLDRNKIRILFKNHLGKIKRWREYGE
ncbi:CobW family GTP-binding protein [Oceanirhabdus sp. W0125-5]|uniref:CobW family GTP-binding protein n=1 Tax=Oceanirhabdus sp. W0125-5 TaxID=2999116 RepID=UPI0022F34551|nr:GTP-binding protein [Oceanirhabdus sp. W0125-5]WBW95908.1 GTP-binding protein [Oceanirhabdus sp. W0125-5]